MADPNALLVHQLVSALVLAHSPTYASDEERRLRFRIEAALAPDDTAERCRVRRPDVHTALDRAGVAGGTGPERVAMLAAERDEAREREGITFRQTDTDIAAALVRRYATFAHPVRVRDTLEAARGNLQRETENVAKIREALGAGPSESTLDAVVRVMAHGRWLCAEAQVGEGALRDLARVQAALDAAGVDKTGDSASRIERLAAWRERETEGRVKAERLAGAATSTAAARPVVHVDLDDARMTAQVTVGGHVVAQISACQRRDRIGGVSYGVQLQGSPDLVGIGHGT